MKLGIAVVGSSLVLVVGCSQVGSVQHPPDPPGNIDMSVPRFVGPQPSFGPTVTAATPPRPLSGGTLLMTSDGKRALAADPDRDRAYLVDVGAGTLSATVTLNVGDEPGRAVEDRTGKLHLVLRGGGAVATIDPATAAVTERKAVCAAPRGIAYEPGTDRVHVACAGGELVSLPATGGDPVRTIALERDLRDVAVVGAQLWVSTLRTARLLIVNSDGTVASPVTLPHGFDDFKGETAPAVAWRTMTLPGGHVAIAHQRALVGPVQTTEGGYGGDGGSCGGIVQSAVSLVDGATHAVASLALGNVVLPVDLAYAPAGDTIALLSAGNGHTPQLDQVALLPTNEIVVPSPMADAGVGGGGGCVATTMLHVDGEPIALAYDQGGSLWVQTREPAALQKISTMTQAVLATVALSSDSRADTGWALFHSNSGASIACASCHPEGGEDAHVWEFDKLGPRRTQSLRGHVGGTEPFHWGGELPNFAALVGEVYLRRMAGPMLTDDQAKALFDWVDTIPLIAASPPADAAAVARGKALFEDTTHAACASCHSGPELTNNASADVGTGGVFQVPRLVGVGWRAPFLHDGCAATLTDRFTSCGGTTGMHGVTAQLTAADIADLVAYLQTL